MNYKHGLSKKIKNCLVCGRDFIAKDDYLTRNQIYCSRKCYGKTLKGKKKSKVFCQMLKEMASETWKNPEIRAKRIRGMMGRKLSDKVKEKIGKRNKKNWLNKSEIEKNEFRQMARERQKRLFQNPEYRKNLSDVHKGKIGYWRNKKRPEISGENCHLWRGGRTKLVKQIRESIEYKKWRKAIFIRDNYICQLCKKKGYKIQVDHYPKSFNKILKENQIDNLEKALNCEELWNINNGRTLCLDCHKKTENYLVKPCQVIINRFEKFTGVKTVKIN